MNHEYILLDHGSGGKMSGKLIRECFLQYFDNPALNAQTDSAIVETGSGFLAYTTDSYVIDPLFFPGGDIGKLAVCGTVNDLSVSGAVPLYISAAFIIEEGLRISDLMQIARSMAGEARKAGVMIVTGDTKVVGKGQCDKLFINTSGMGALDPRHKHISGGDSIRPGDAVLVNGDLGDHAIAILGARENIQFEEAILSDCTSLNSLIRKILDAGIRVKFMRDLTRGGLATVLAELVDRKPYGITISEAEIPVKESVRGTCEIFGFDPLYLANEGKFIIVVGPEDTGRALGIMRSTREGAVAAKIGEIVPDHAGRTVMRSITGGNRMIDKLSGRQLPRIC